MDTFSLGRVAGPIPPFEARLSRLKSSLGWDKVVGGMGLAETDREGSEAEARRAFEVGLYRKLQLKRHYAVVFGVRVERD